MDRGEGDPLRVEIEGCQHHVRTVQRVDEVGRKSISILACVDTETRNVSCFVSGFQELPINSQNLLTSWETNDYASDVAK